MSQAPMPKHAAPMLKHKARIGAVATAVAGLMIVASAEANGKQGLSSELEQSTIRMIENYCITSWRNARLPQNEWSDCTQQVFLELLETMSQEQVTIAIDQPETDERRELNRAIWRIGKRVKRRMQPLALNEYDVPSEDQCDRFESLNQQIDEIKDVAAEKLGNRQGKIFEMLMKGEPVNQIAHKLKTSPARVSDAKYRAIKKLREALV